MDIRDRGNRENNVNKKTVEAEEGGGGGVDSGGKEGDFEDADFGGAFL
jgi:hypothetical protein